MIAGWKKQVRVRRALYMSGLLLLLCLLPYGVVELRDMWAWWTDYVRDFTVFVIAIVTLCGLYAFHWNEKRIGKQYAAIDAEFAQTGQMHILRPLPDAKWGAKQAVQFWSQAARLLQGVNYLQMGLCGAENDLAFYVITRNWQDGQLFKNQLFGDYVGIQIETVKLEGDDNPLRVPDGWQVAEVVLKERDWKIPLQSKSSEPLAALLSHISRLKTDDKVRGGINVFVRSGFEAHLRAKRERNAILNPKAQKVKAGKTVKYVKPKVDKEAASQLADRVQNSMLEAHIVLWAMAENPNTATTIAQQLAKELTAQFVGENPLQLHTIGNKKYVPSLFRRYPKIATTNTVKTAYAPTDGAPMTDNDLAQIMHLVADTGVAIAPGLRVVVEEAEPVPHDAGELPAEAIKQILRGLTQ